MCVGKCTWNSNERMLFLWLKTFSPSADFVAVLTGVTDSWLPSSSGVARARFSLTRTSLAFSITYQRYETKPVTLKQVLPPKHTFVSQPQHSYKKVLLSLHFSNVTIHLIAKSMHESKKIDIKKINDEEILSLRTFWSVLYGLICLTLSVVQHKPLKKYIMFIHHFSFPGQNGTSQQNNLPGL